MPSTPVRGLELFHEEIGPRHLRNQPANPDPGPRTETETETDREIETDAPLVFLSGLGGDHRAFSATTREFARAGHRALALDHRDSGFSARAAAPYPIAELAEDAAAWMAALHLPPAHVVGHSMGGLVAQILALRHPERVRSLALVSTHSGGDPWRKAVIESWMILRPRVDPATFARATLPYLVAPDFYRDPERPAGLVRFAERNARPQEPEAFLRQAAAVVGFDALERPLETLEVPVLVLVGERDLLNPPAVARAIADRLPRARLRVLENVGHLPHVESPGPFRAAIAEFLAELETRP